MSASCNNKKNNLTTEKVNVCPADAFFIRLLIEQKMLGKVSCFIVKAKVIFLFVLGEFSGPKVANVRMCNRPQYQPSYTSPLISSSDAAKEGK